MSLETLRQTNKEIEWKEESETDKLIRHLKEARNLLIAGKRQFAPNTTNSDVDYFIAKTDYLEDNKENE